MGPHGGFGDVTDSLGSCTHLIPKPPKKDFQKSMDNAMKVLRFPAQMKNPAIEDRDRRFMIRFYLNEDVMDVCETPQRNSGIVAGRYMSKCPVFKNGVSGEKVQARDLHEGKEILLKGVMFEITGVDQFTQNYFE